MWMQTDEGLSNVNNSGNVCLNHVRIVDIYIEPLHQSHVKMNHVRQKINVNELSIMCTFEWLLIVNFEIGVLLTTKTKTIKNFF